VLGIVHEFGFSSVLIPGSGMSTFDSYEANIFETGNQRKERVVHTLLEKLEPATISLQVETVG
jgi:U3 small nucleolar RNA-associated protein 7